MKTTIETFLTLASDPMNLPGAQFVDAELYGDFPGPAWQALRDSVGQPPADPRYGREVRISADADGFRDGVVVVVGF